jgi:Cu2+-containing amine oxidase
MYYRPVCIYGSKCFKFTIRDTLKILNTDDNTTIVKTATLTYDNPSRYGKRMNRIYMSETPDIVKVYNRRTDVDIDGTNEVINITNSSGGSGSGSGSTGLKIETTTQNITSFIESRKIACSISQVPVSLLDYDY